MKRAFQSVSDLRGAIRALIYTDIVDEDDEMWEDPGNKRPQTINRKRVAHGPHWDEVAERDKTIVRIFKYADIDSVGWSELKRDCAFWREVVKALNFVPWEVEVRDKSGALISVTQQFNLADIFDVVGYEIGSHIEALVDNNALAGGVDASNQAAKDVFMKYVSMYDDDACQNFLILYGRFRLLMKTEITWKRFEIHNEADANAINMFEERERRSYDYHEVQRKKTQFTVEYDTPELDYSIFSSLTVRDIEGRVWRYQIWQPKVEKPDPQKNPNGRPQLRIKLDSPDPNARSGVLRLEVKGLIFSIVKMYYGEYLYLCCNGEFDSKMLKLHRTLSAIPPYERLIIENFTIDFSQWEDTTYIDAQQNGNYCTTVRSSTSLAKVSLVYLPNLALLKQEEEDRNEQKRSKREQLIRDRELEAQGKPIELKAAQDINMLLDIPKISLALQLNEKESEISGKQKRVMAWRSVRIPLDANPTSVYVAMLTQSKPEGVLQYGLLLIRYNEIMMTGKGTGKTKRTLAATGNQAFILGAAVDETNPIADETTGNTRVWDMQVIFFTELYFYVQVTYITTNMETGSDEYHTRSSAWFAFDPRTDISRAGVPLQPEVGMTDDPTAMASAAMDENTTTASSTTTQPVSALRNKYVPDLGMIDTLKKHHYFVFDFRHSFNLAQSIGARYDLVFYKRDYPARRSRFIFYKVHTKGFSTVGDLYLYDDEGETSKYPLFTLPLINGFAVSFGGDGFTIAGKKGLCVIRIQKPGGSQALQHFLVVDFEGNGAGEMKVWDENFDLSRLKLTDESCFLCGTTLKAKIMEKETGALYCDAVCHYILNHTRPFTWK